ncbi:unnamed protein product [Prorocentrum cordatum]|uniref:Uncharacterized protein n=1 Tax=Prorocentrum cordatum TaxID=2364126 RepID=A0ABN9Y0F5_9DINO|nr:unnamed protein product [Polarella glacialis]
MASPRPSPAWCCLRWLSALRSGEPAAPHGREEAAEAPAAGVSPAAGAREEVRRHLVQELYRVRHQHPERRGGLEKSPAAGPAADPAGLDLHSGRLDAAEQARAARLGRARRAQASAMRVLVPLGCLLGFLLVLCVGGAARSIDAARTGLTGQPAGEEHGVAWPEDDMAAPLPQRSRLHAISDSLSAVTSCVGHIPRWVHRLARLGARVDGALQLARVPRRGSPDAVEAEPLLQDGAARVRARCPARAVLGVLGRPRQAGGQPPSACRDAVLLAHLPRARSTSAARRPDERRGLLAAGAG